PYALDHHICSLSTSPRLPSTTRFRSTFVALSVPKKLVVMLGGPVMNLLISIVLMTVMVSGIGLPAVTPTVQSVSECTVGVTAGRDRKRTRLNSSHVSISYAVSCLEQN